MSRVGDTRGGTVSISSTLGKRRVVALFGTGGWGCVGDSDINKESIGRLPAASKSDDSYCQMGEAACGSGVKSLVPLCGMTCWSACTVGLIHTEGASLEKPQPKHVRDPRFKGLLHKGHLSVLLVSVSHKSVCIQLFFHYEKCVRKGFTP